MDFLKWTYKKIYKKEPPYYYNYSMSTIIKKPLRKFMAQVIIPNCPFNNLRVILYRMIGFKIGKNTFIGMKCYLDDMCFDLLKIGNNVTISYGVYFACHGHGQGHYPIIINDGVYIGMRASIITKNGKSKTGIYIGENAVIGSCSLINKNVPDNSIAVGIPCRILSEGKDE